jgi:TonB family protein
MQRRYSLLIAAILFAGSSAPAFAQFRCDCTSIVDSCSADVAVRGNWVEITTDRQQCSRVDYFLDGQPFVAVVVDGEDRQAWIPRAESPRIMVQSCQVCRDSASSGGAAASQAPSAQAAAAASEPGDDRLRPLIEVPPVYPNGSGGVEGYVDVEVTVGPRGDVQDASVAAAQPPGRFDQAALAAVRRWRYPEQPGREPHTVTERVEFRPGAGGADATTASGAPVTARRSDNGARNQCVRQGSLFNYGELIEIGLLNACDVPIMVFGCAEGSSQYRGHWVCTTSEQQQNVLVRSDDDRVGTTTSVASNGGLMSLTYADRFFLSRAPNAEYWWLACAVDDDDCRSAARQWTRSMDKQLASVDPQGRSSRAVARSY